MDDNEQLAWDIGSVFMMGFSGTTVNPHVKQLIEQHHLGTIMLSGKNFKSAEQATKLILELQTIARNAGHPHPLLIAIDQENGGLNNLCDTIHIRQFPGAMGMVATGSPELCREVAKATALEVSSVGVNWVLGPVLDVLNPTARTQPLGVRTMGHEPEEVSEMGVAFMRGLQEGGVATCGKHFPSYGNIEFQGSPLDVPMLSDTIEQLKLHGLIPFRKAVAADIDAIMVGGCSMPSLGTKVMHACLSDTVINKLLREEMGFKGVVVSECLEMEALHENIGVGQATVMALDAGCDQIIVCRSFTLQMEAIQGLGAAVDSGIITQEMVSSAAARVALMKQRRTSWQKALNPPGIDYLAILEPSHKQLSVKAYEASITIVRDEKRLIPMLSELRHDDEVLLLTPLVKPLPASLLAQAEALAASTRLESHRSEHSPTPTSTAGRTDSKALLSSFLSDKDRTLMTGESVFRELGRSLARNTGTRILHTSYTANGIRPVHENLIERASMIIIVTADANQNRYQYGFTKHISAISKIPTDGFPNGKSVVVLAVSSPYDFWLDKTIATYVCTYDFTETAIDAMVKVLFGRKPAAGMLPGSIFKRRKQQIQPKQQWLVEPWKRSRDLPSLQELLRVVLNASLEQDPPGPGVDLLSLPASAFLLDDAVLNDGSTILEQQNFVVRNSSTRALYGFCSTYYNPRNGLGSIGLIIVDPSRRSLSIGNSLHASALRHLRRKNGIKRISIGTRFPSIFLGLPATANPNMTMLNLTEGTDPNKTFKAWFRNLGWPETPYTRVHRLILDDLPGWKPETAISKDLAETGVTFDLLSEHSAPGCATAEDVLEYVSTMHHGRNLDPYRIACEDVQLGQARILVARNPQKQIIGTVILVWTTHHIGKLEKFTPLIRSESNAEEVLNVCGILYPVFSVSPLRATAVGGVVALSTKHFQMPHPGVAGFDKIILDPLDSAEDAQIIIGDGSSGWQVWHSFEEMECNLSELKTS
ncbi:Beta-hexosaminidase [Arthrobotrys entomopaga]|nr:Beta-hexosaminidase [Arthrobotrys entomopaga]